MLFKKQKKINILRLEGVIGSSKKMLSIKNCKKLIDKAFDDKKAIGVSIIVNSPGGSPSQSEIISNYILEKSKETKKEVITFAEDVAASGGYWLLLVGSKIYALSNTSIVGSLGVLYASFGLEDFIEKHSIKRRVYTAGKNKVSLDMFQKEKQEDIERLQGMLQDTHKHFKNWVLKQRGSKLKIEEEELFSGEFWIASKGLEKGLIDEVCSLEIKIKELYGKKVKLNYIEAKKSIIPSFLGSKNISKDLVSSLISEVKQQSFWNKFGM